MNESGPVNRPKKAFTKEGEFSDITLLHSNVYRATLDGKYWILKTAKSSEASSSILLRREYELSCNLSHPCVLNSLFFLEESPVGPAIMMEYIEGRTLEEFVHGGKPSEALRKKILFQIMDAVNYVHNRGLLHNDIKPSNILVTEIGNDVKIIDFGFSENDADYLNRKLGGTVGATAPEVLTGDISEQSVASSDIYSLGGIIHLLFPARLSGIVRKCRSSRPETRYRDVSSLRGAIRRAFAFPYVLSAVIVLASLLAVSIIPDMKRHRQEQMQNIELAERDAKVAEIEEYLNSLYTACADTLSNRNLVPSQLQAFPVRTHFVQKYVEFRSTVNEQEMLFVCDTIYARLIASLSEMMLDLPEE